jgi:ATP:ADP antiporter, AAA family
MLYSIIRFFWPDLSDQDIKKYGLLSIVFFFTVGGYWLLKTLKEGFFYTIVGSQYQPKAKILSLVVISVTVLIYSKLVDLFRRHKLFYILGSFYLILFSVITYFISFPTTGSDAINPTVLKAIGWVSYFLIESYGSVMIVLFWSFVASVSDASSAKKSYSLVVASGQVGAIIGPFLAWHAKCIGLTLLFSIATLSIVFLMLTIRYFIKIIPREQLVPFAKEETQKTKPGFLEGLKLLLTKPYLMGIFIISAIYEIVATIVEYQMMVQAKPFYPTKEALISFTGIFGMGANGLALFMALLGTGYFFKNFGLRKTLLIFPISLGAAIALLYVAITFSEAYTKNTLFITLGVMIIAKGLSYALNNPAKEILYIPTSKDAKFKTKGWIDMFGSRGAKATGSAVTDFLKGSPEILLSIGTILSLGLIGIWIFVAVLVGKKFHNITTEGKIVG